MRLEYETAGLGPGDLAAEPIDQFHRWMEAAVAAGVTEPNAMVLSTVDSDGQPWGRYVLLKAATPSGFDFYTNYGSDKSLQLSGQPRASLTFGWLDLRRQVNVTGTVGRVPSEESDAYWGSRPRGSQIGGWASEQSRPLDSRQELLERYAELEAALGDPVPRPEHWGGWRVKPQIVDFWQGRADRLHDRFRYRYVGDGWRVSRINP